MLSKEEIEKAKDDFSFFNEGDYITKEMSNSKDIILEYIEQLENENKDLQKSVEQIYDDYQDIGKIAFDYSDKIEQLESDKQKLIEKLEKDIVNITKTMKDGKHRDYYSKCRLKAYRTKTKEILELVKGVENEL